MNYIFWIQIDQLPVISAELKNKVSVLETKDNMFKVEVTLENDMDALSLFHAGIMSILNKI
ncbi:MAG: hypothetical protein JSU03_05035 [Bacteroidetes bacterium]|nr:hypothetical protein [Bacteroidota bacterium]